MAGDILTPPNARKTEEFSVTQVELVRNSLGIGDFPFNPDKTYIIFDADAGDNNLHIDTGASSTYSILKGNGGLSGGTAIAYTDTGGTKILNYDVAGRYLITIEGTFQGINTSGASGADKNKYHSIIVGANHPITLADYALDSCQKLRSVISEHLTAFGDYTFNLCILLETALSTKLTTIGEGCLLGCESLINFYPNKITSVGINSLKQCKSLPAVAFPLLTSFPNGLLSTCFRISEIDAINVTTIGDGALNGILALNELVLGAVTSIGTSQFSSGNILTSLSIGYTSGLTVSANAFNNLKLKDLYVTGAANLTEAQSVETKLTAAGMTQLNGYRLLY